MRIGTPCPTCRISRRSLIYPQHTIFVRPYRNAMSRTRGIKPRRLPQFAISGTGRIMDRYKGEWFD